MDDECVFHESTPKHKPARENMQWYMDNFGVSFQLPSIYIHDALFFPTDPRNNLQLVNFAFPNADGFEVAMHNFDGSYGRSTFKQINANLSNGLVLRHLVRENSTLNQVDEVSLYQSSAFMKFSEDGDLFALFYPEIQNIKIFKVESIKGFIQQIKDMESNKGSYLVNYDGSRQGLRFVEKIELDQNKRFFIGFG